MSDFLSEFKRNSKAIERDLDEVLQKYGMKIQRGVGGKFGPDHATLKIEVVKLGADPFSQYVRPWTAYAGMDGLEPGWLGCTFTTPKGNYTIRGYNPKKPKYSVVTTHESGKVSLWPSQSVKFYMTGGR